WYITRPISLGYVLAAVLAFSWAARRGQFDDLETPALRMLHDDEPATGTRSRPSAPHDAPRP
ncbi:MAG TPA: cbb3-type cytochrome oxidase assembly protein CcoS, partial [Gemmatimonadaceae bacterium]|nr:cbb3-type cytochrome oxidase assembly protein CcoS [Gemmatimonadaceae bacterium]